MKLHFMVLVLMACFLIGCEAFQPTEQSANRDALAIKIVTRSAITTAYGWGKLDAAGLDALSQAAMTMQDLLDLPIQEAAKLNLLGWLEAEGCLLAPTLRDAVDLFNVYYDVRPLGELMSAENRVRFQGLIDGLHEGVERCRS